MLKKSVYVCPSCGFKTEAPTGTKRSCFECNTRLIEKHSVVTKGEEVPKETEPITEPETGQEAGTEKVKEPEAEKETEKKPLPYKRNRKVK